MKNNSKYVVSNQSGIHDNLKNVVLKHRDSEFKKPVQEHNVQAFKDLCEAIQVVQGEVLLDSCCGTGQSSINLAHAHPDKLVIGIDQSEVRLSKAQQSQDNLLLLRANCEDIWRLMVEHDFKVSRHFILFPNPWPKSVHLKRRWHGHPVFKYLPELSEQVELRSNWKTYLEEFALAWHLITGNYCDVESYQPEQVNAGISQNAPYLTLFEKKYHQSGQELYRLVCKKG